MRLLHKVKKVANPRTYDSAKRHVGRLWLMRRPVFRLNVERLMKTISATEFESIRRRYAIECPAVAKYLNLREWMRTNLRRVLELELDYGFRKRILDIGCGAGYFLHICRWLGHDVVGLDIGEEPMYDEMTRMLGLKRVLWRVQAFEPLPDFGEKFDLITAFMICFNGHKTAALWGTAEWEYFLDDIAAKLTPVGWIQLQFNRETDGGYHTKELHRFFEKRGAIIDRSRVMFRSRRISISSGVERPCPWLPAGSPRMPSPTKVPVSAHGASRVSSLACQMPAQPTFKRRP